MKKYKMLLLAGGIISGIAIIVMAFVFLAYLIPAKKPKSDNKPPVVVIQTPQYDTLVTFTGTKLLRGGEFDTIFYAADVFDWFDIPRPITGISQIRVDGNIVLHDPNARSLACNGSCKEYYFRVYKSNRKDDVTMDYELSNFVKK
jgi:hypothetical protein